MIVNSKTGFTFVCKRIIILIMQKLCYVNIRSLNQKSVFLNTSSAEFSGFYKAKTVEFIAKMLA